MNIRKYFQLTLSALLLTAIMTSCSVSTTSSRSGKVPPGQAKKMSGSKSAKAFAPGQVKKR